MSMPFDYPPPPNPNRTNIPAARALIEDALRFMAAFHPDTNLEQAMLRTALSMMTRRPKQRRRTIAAAMDRDKVLAILAEHRSHPDWTDLEIARLAHINVNPGRVNEVRNGLRTPDTPSYQATEGTGHDR